MAQLTKRELAAREGMFNASFTPILMAGDEEKINLEWRLAIGDPQAEPPDFRFNWPVQFGSHVEKFVLDWHQRSTKRKLIRRRERVIHPVLKHIGATLDAFREDDSCVLDCKVVGKFRPIEAVISYYTPQLYVQRACAGATAMALLVVHGGSEPEEHPVAFDAAYEKEVFDRIAWFWGCVETMTEPHPVAPVAAPMPAVKEYAFGTDNEWCWHAGAWSENREAAKKFEAAAKEIKARVPDDAARAVGGGIVVTRNKAGSLSIREDK